MYNNATNSETKEVVVDVGETGGDVVRWWPAGTVRGPSVPFCGRYDAIYTSRKMLYDICNKATVVQHT